MSVFGVFAPVSGEELAGLCALPLAQVSAELKIVREELASFEHWLRNPPADATAEDVCTIIAIWDGCRQWLIAYEETAAEKKGAELLGGAGCSVCDGHFGCVCAFENGV